MEGVSLDRNGGERVDGSAAPAHLSSAQGPQGRLRRQLWLGLGCVVLLCAVAAARWPLRDMVVPWDSKNQFFVFFRFMASSIHAGSTPFWNPYEYAGFPSIADPQSLIFAPAFVIWAIFDPAPSLFAFDLLVYAHLLVGGLAMVAYGHRRAWPISASVLAAVVFMFGGAASGRLMHVGVITVYGLFPLAVLWLEETIERNSFRAAMGLGVVAAMIALGRSQVPLLLCFSLAAVLIGAIATAPRPLRFLAARAPALLIALVAFVAVAAVPMLLTLQFASLSNRPAIDLETALRSSLYPLNFANFFAPDIFGSLRPLNAGDWGPAYSTRPAIDSTDRAFNYLFAGTFTALLFVWHGLMGARIVARGRRVFACIAAFAVLYAIGRYSPFFPVLFRYLPGIDLFRRPVGATFLFNLALAYLAGHLVADHVRAGAPKLTRLALLAGVTLVGGLLAWAVEFSALRSRGVDAFAQIAFAAPAYLGLIALLILPRSRLGRSRAAMVAVAFAAVELIVNNVASQLNAEPRANYAMLEKPTPQASRIVQTIADDMRVNAPNRARPRVEILGLGGPWQNAAMLYDLEATNGYNPLRIGSYDRLVDPGESTWEAVKRRYPNSFRGYDCLLARMLGLEYVVLDRPIDRLPNHPRRAHAIAILSGPDVWIYRLPRAQPRVSIETRVEIADAGRLLAEGAFPDNLSPAETIVDAADSLSQRYLPDFSKRTATAKISAWRPDRVEIEVNASAPAILTLHDLWYPGWEVYVDGVQKSVLRSNLLFRGVELPAGARHVEFVYRPLSFINLRAAFLSAWRSATHALDAHRKPSGADAPIADFGLHPV